MLAYRAITAVVTGNCVDVLDGLWNKDVTGVHSTITGLIAVDIIDESASAGIALAMTTAAEISAGRNRIIVKTFLHRKKASNSYSLPNEALLGANEDNSFVESAALPPTPGAT
jgi:hypothetical protein